MATKAALEDKDEGSTEKTAKSLADIVPSLYYDLIARVCPGAAFWVLISLVSSKFQQIFSIGDLSGYSLVLLVLFSYLSGIVLSGFCLVWDAMSFKLLSAREWLGEPLGLAKTNSLTKQWQLVAQKMEALTKVSQDPGRIVTKALAEVTLCQNLLTGLLVLAAIGYFSDGIHFYEPQKYPGTFSIFFGAFLISMLFRQMMFLGRTQALYEMYVASKAL